MPASTSNLGPGFDTLGLALDWRVKVEACRQATGLDISVDFSGLVEWEEPLISLIRAAAFAWERQGLAKADGVSMRFSGDVPIARGLGSSAAYRLLCVFALNALFARPLADEDLLELVCRLETHTDNAVPCLLGGLTVSGWDEKRVRYVRFPVAPRFRLVVLVPERELVTEEARKVLPESVSREDAVFNMQRALWLTWALVNDRPEDLVGSFQDRLHQPFRERLLPFMDEVIRAAENAGAYGGFLSGAGSSVIAVTDDERREAVSQTMLGALEKSGAKGSARTVRPDNQGLCFLD